MESKELKISKVSRSVYQKKCEENKKLRKDIKALTYHGGKVRISVYKKWNKIFHREKEFDDLIRRASIEYIKANKDRLPDFLTKGIEEK